MAFQGEVFQATTDWRLIVGLGQKGPLEAGFTFHPLYGIPIIPGSALKGLARAYAHLVEGLDETDASFRTVFGRASKRPGEDQIQAEAGQAIFFDAIPVQKPRLDLDVMTPHFPDYYRDQVGTVPPASWQSPEPVYFLTVAPGTAFLFAIGWRGPLDEKGHRLQRAAREWLVNGLRHLGAGAKTSAGYGYFSPAEEKPEGRAEPSPGLGLGQEREKPEGPLTWRTGTVREYRPDKGQGRLVDDETGEELPFGREALEDKGYSPGKKHRVQFAVAERDGKKKAVAVRKT
ncbi:MAG: type III-B CRISPR module RAMP protein Cmr6 [Anaerolineae bacterium]